MIFWLDVPLAEMEPLTVSFLPLANDIVFPLATVTVPDIIVILQFDVKLLDHVSLVYILISSPVAASAAAIAVDG